MSLIRSCGMCLLFAALALAYAGPSYASTVLYPAPSGAVLSPDYSVKVNGQAISIYRGKKGNSAIQDYSFAYFDFFGTVTVEVTMNSPLMKTPIIRPTSKGITWTLNNKTMTFTLSNPTQISIEPDSGGIIDATPLLLFANPLEVNPPQAGAAGVLYYGPGVHTLPSGGLSVPSNTTVYIAGGALVKGRLVPQGSNITIRGRGILDNLGVYGAATNQPMLNPKNCTNLLIEGIILKDSGSWTVQIVESSYVTITNLKIVSSVGLTGHDGIHTVNSNHVTIQDSFIHSDDDNIGISGMWNSATPVDTVSVSRCVFWANASNNWRIGWQAQAAYISNLTFTDIDILHRTSYSRVVTIETSGNGTVGTPVTNVRFENIRIEADYGWTGNFIQLVPGASIGLDGALAPPGRIQNVTLRTSR